MIDLYNIKDILSEEEKNILKKNKINYDVVINTDEDMKNYISIIFDNVSGFKNIQNISDSIVEYHKKFSKMNK